MNSDKRTTLSYFTLIAISAIAFVIACVGHEAVGHGGACLARGGRVLLLTSVYFRCAPGEAITDAAGPLMNLALGAIFYLALRAGRRLSANSRRFLVLAMAFNLFWGAGYFIFSSITAAGDWAFVFRDLGLEPRWLWRCAMGLLGAGLYYGAMRLIVLHRPSGTSLLISYLTAGTVSGVAVLFFDGPTIPALWEAAKESFGAAMGLLILARASWRRKEEPDLEPQVSHSIGWMVAATIVILAFFFTLGRGLVISPLP